MGSIRNRVRLILGLSVISIVFLGVFAGYFLNKHSQWEEEKTDVQKALMDSDEIRYEMSLTRQKEQQFLASPSQESAEEMEKAISDVESSASNFADEHKNYQAIAENFTAISENAAKYKEQMEPMVNMYRMVGFSEEEGLLKTIKETFAEFEKLVDGLDSPELDSALMEIKVLEQEYIEQGKDGEAESKLTEATRAFSNLIENSELSEKESSEISSGLLKYQQSLNTIANTNTQSAAITDSFSKVADDVSSQVEQVKTEAETISSKLSADQANARQNMTTLFIILGVLALLTMSIIGLILIRSIGRSISSLKEGAQIIGDGNLAYRVPITTKDEMAELADTFNSMAQKMEQSMLKVNNASKVLSDSSTNLAAISEQSSAQTEEVNEAINQVATGSQNQALRIEESSQLIEAVSGAITNTNNAAVDISDALELAEKEGNTGLETMKTLEGTSTSFIDLAGHLSSEVKQAADQSKQITSIVSAIEEIADSTNLLALNAAIESARAGESGRGFAVVADEVRKLAERSKHEAQEIQQLVKTMHAQMHNLTTEAGKFDTYQQEQSTAVDQTKAAFHRIANHIYKMNDKIKGVKDSLQDVGSANNDLREKMEQISVISEEAVATAEEVAASSETQSQSIEEVNQSAVDLQGLSQELAAEVSQFNLDETRFQDIVEQDSEKIENGIDDTDYYLTDNEEAAAALDLDKDENAAETDEETVIESETQTDEKLNEHLDEQSVEEPLEEKHEFTDDVAKKEHL
ncbi:methyl-accepting chemotaxis protein [Sediminibacillus halophilus]|uniref:Methyl-accepting chemotaxis protein n=1 Tax=Sediminibacillus halophilus TaxID=482461 RepID=A0A1G9Y3L2_9BACI|nr:methyl-accepting chemotaxis protein [Sediminibacillus halophilus]SDN03648.1 methyl-accepting chemotaxis protein [Sediminibacillus halophilus]